MRVNFEPRMLELSISLPGPVEIPSIGRVVIPIGLRAGYEKYVVTGACVKLMGSHDCLSDIEASLCPEEKMRATAWAPTWQGLGTGPGYGEPVIYRPEMYEFELNANERLDSMVGLPVTGMWYLVVEDLIARDPGVLRYALVVFEGLNEGSLNPRTRRSRLEMPLGTPGRAFDRTGQMVELKEPVVRARPAKS